ncbi:MAG: winged helix-turn-helix domain-containing protein [Woeseiaceae bacterium]
MSFDSQQDFRLGEWTVYPSLNRVTANDESQVLEGKVMAVLLALVARHGTVVSKHELLDSVWQNQSVAEGVLTRAIHELRRVLGDNAQQPRFIETVSRRGYILICPPESIEPSVAPKTGRQANPINRPMAVVAVCIASLALFAFIYNSSGQSNVESVAVLPFVNLTGDESKGYIGDGLAESVIHVIAQQENIAVAARTSSFSFRGQELTAEEIGGRLNVGAIIEGSVREERGVQRITIQLIKVSTGAHLASVTLDVVDNDLFDAQGRIADSILAMLADTGTKIQFGTRSGTREAAANAYDFFLKGRAALHARTEDSLRNAQAYFEESIRFDAQFAPTYAGLAQLYLISRVYLQLDAAQSQSLAEDSSRKALELNPDNVDALMVMAALTADRGDYEQSMRLFETVLDVEPSNAQAHQWYGEVQATLGYLERSRTSVETALRLNPLAGSTISVRAKIAELFDDDPTLFAAANHADSLGAMMASRSLALHAFRNDNAQDFATAMLRYHRVVGIDPGATELLVAAMKGEIAEAEFLNQLIPLGLSRDNFFARELAMLGLPDSALSALVRGTAGDGAYASDVWMPEFKDVRAAPEFVEVIEAMGLDRYWATHELPDLCRGVNPEPFCGHF